MAGSTAEAAALARQLLQRRENGNGYAPWLDRRRCRAVVERQGLPVPRSEAWRHTNLAPWYAAARASEVGDADARVQVPEGVRALDFADPQAAALASRHGGDVFDLAEHPLAAVNGLLLGAGVVVHAPANARPTEPVRIERLGASFQRVLLVVAPGASLVLIEEPARFTHRIVECVVGANAELTHLRRQGASTGCECSLVAARVAAGGRYTLAQTSLGARLRRNDVIAELGGTEAEARVFGAWRLDGEAHLDNQVLVRHASGGGNSRQTYRGVADGRSRAVLCGGIHIAPGADGTDAALSAKNLLASRTAQVFAKPALQIHASDVKCGHGATVGALDAEAIHYLRSRGVGEEAARALLVRGFLAEAVRDAEGARAVGLLP